MIAVPEPTTVLLLGLGLVGLAALAWLRLRRKPPSGPRTPGR